MEVAISKLLNLVSSVMGKVATSTVLWNTDGVPIFKSSGFSIWPIFLMINELPFHLR